MAVVGKGLVDASCFFAEGGFAVRFESGGVFVAHGVEQLFGGLAGAVGVVLLLGVARGEEVAEEGSEGVGAVGGSEGVVGFAFVDFGVKDAFGEFCGGVCV